MARRWQSWAYRDGRDEPRRFGRITRWRRGAFLLELLCGGGLVVATWLMWSGFLAGAHFFGETPTPSQQHRATVDFRAAAVVALACSAVGVAVAWRRRSRAVRVLCGATGVLALVGAVLVFSAPTEEPTPAPSPVHCQEHSGGDTVCPGG